MPRKGANWRGDEPCDLWFDALQAGTKALLSEAPDERIGPRSPGDDEAVDETVWCRDFKEKFYDQCGGARRPGVGTQEVIPLSRGAAYAFATMTMADVSMDFDLPEGWSCSVEFERTAEGVYAGRAELRLESTWRCVLVVTQQPTREVALACMKYRALRFVEEWSARAGQAAERRLAHPA
ncbi:MAG TPA: hypothetical protein VN280_10425 [Variovorax sp.]|nr:hypothetical protein [Variovorax sp.]